MRVSKKSSKVAAIAVIAILAMAISSAAQQSDSQVVKPESANLSAKAIPTTHIGNFGCINSNFYRGARPKTRDYKDLAAMGIKTIINLEGDGDRNAERDATAAGMKFFHIPMSDKDAPSDATVQEFLKLANDPANQPIFVHCKGGRHRTGLVTAVYRMEHDGWTADQAFDEMKRFDFGYGWGHGDLKTYVYSYHAHTPQNNVVGATSTTNNAK
jgi:tyrosine-protein phosphatase SIW14